MNLEQIAAGRADALGHMNDAFDELEVACRNLNDKAADVVDDTPPPPADVPEEEAVAWVATGKMAESGQTLQTYLDAEWSYAQMEANGLVEKKTFSVPEPPADTTPPPPPADTTPPLPPADTTPPPPADTTPPPPAEEPKYVMTLLAKGTSYQEFITKGWVHAQIVDAGFVEVPEVEADPEPDPQTFPWQDGGGNWIDKSGAVHDPEKHACGATKDTPPPLKVDGTFKKSKKRPAAATATPPPPPPPATDTAPPPPPAAEESATPAPPPPAAEESTTPAPPAAEETDADLESIMSNFNSEGGDVA